MNPFQFDQLTDEQRASLPPEARAQWADMRARMQKQNELIEEMASERKFTEALVMIGSEKRADRIAEWDETYGFTDDEARAIVNDYWSLTEAWSADDLRREAMFGLLTRVAPIHVLMEAEYGEVRPLPDDEVLTLYRGNLGETPGEWMASWTLDMEIAERFARMAASPRGWFLGMSTPDDSGVPSVWRARGFRSDVLGYFDDRAEREVVIDGSKLWDVELIRQAVAREEE